MKKFLALTIVAMLALACIPASALDLLSGADTYPLNSDKTITWYAESNLNPHEKYADWTESPFHTGLSEMLGVNIEWIIPTAGSTGSVFTNTLLADPANLPDIMMTHWMNDANLYLEDGIIWDLTPYIQEYAPAYYAFLQSNPAYDRAMKTDEGQYYTFGFFREDGGWNDTYLGPVIRTDWLEECGLEAPKTVSEFENVIRVFNEKYGAKFSFAWSRFRSTGISGAFGAFGASDETWFVQDGVVDLAQAQPEWRTYVSWLNKLWEEGLLDQDSLSLDDTSIKAKVHNDQVGISITSMGQLTNWNNERVADGKEPVWAGIQYPTGDDGTLSMVFGGPGIGTQTGVITTSADEETMKLCLQMLDYAYTAEGFLYWNFGKEGVSWEYGEDGEPQYTELLANDTDTDPVTKYGGATWGATCIQATKLLYEKNSEAAIAANDIWFYPNEDVTSYWKWPVGATFTLDESDELSLIGQSIGTYCTESFANFLTGARDIDDDAAWEAHLESLKSHNYEEIKEIRQDCYDRYVAR